MFRDSLTGSDVSCFGSFYYCRSVCVTMWRDVGRFRVHVGVTGFLTSEESWSDADFVQVLVVKLIIVRIQIARLELLSVIGTIQQEADRGRVFCQITYRSFQDLVLWRVYVAQNSFVCLTDAESFCWTNGDIRIAFGQECHAVRQRLHAVIHGQCRRSKFRILLYIELLTNYRYERDVRETLSGSCVVEDDVRDVLWYQKKTKLNSIKSITNKVCSWMCVWVLYSVLSKMTFMGS